MNPVQDLDKLPGGKLAKEFKDFLVRGNVVDLAVAVAVGAAFTGVVTSLVKNLITPIVSIPGKTDFSQLEVKVGGGVFTYGAFLNDLLSFILVSTVVFFFVVKPVNHLMARRKTEADVASTTKDCPHCISSIPAAATRYAFCTSGVS